MTYPKSIDRYRSVVAAGLSETHACPPEVLAALLAEYEDVLEACWNGGIAAVAPFKLLYAEWKTFRASQ